MKIYNVAGWALVLAYALACMYFAPPDIGPTTGLLVAARARPALRGGDLARLQALRFVDQHDQN